jgi:hypothetical protein
MISLSSSGYFLGCTAAAAFSCILRINAGELRN